MELGYPGCLDHGLFFYVLLLLFESLPLLSMFVLVYTLHILHRFCLFNIFIIIVLVLSELDNVLIFRAFGQSRRVWNPGYDRGTHHGNVFQAGDVIFVALGVFWGALARSYVALHDLPQ